MRPLLFALLFVATASAQDVHLHVDANVPASATSFPTIQSAVDHIPETPGRVILSIAPGTYHERIIISRDHSRVLFIGLGKTASDVVITASENASSAGGTSKSATFELDADDFIADNITFENAAGNTGQAVAALIRSDRDIFKHCRFLGDQDTLYANSGRQYYVDSYIAGGVDFIFGNASAVFDHDEIHIIRTGYLTAQSRTDPTQTNGYVITNSKVTASLAAHDVATSSPQRRTFYLGRPWRPYARVVIMNTELPKEVDPDGWSIWHKEDPFPPNAYYAEFHNTGPGADTSHRAAWSHQLTAAEAAAYDPAAFLRGTDNWNPIAEAAKLP
jgi:pectinesterase